MLLGLGQVDPRCKPWQEPVHEAQWAYREFAGEEVPSMVFTGCRFSRLLGLAIVSGTVLWLRSRMQKKRR